MKTKKIYTQPMVLVVKLDTSSFCAASPQADEMRDTHTGDEKNTLSGNVYNGNDYEGPQRAKAHEVWDSWD